MVSQYNTISTKDISRIYDMYDNVHPIERSINPYYGISVDGIQNLINEINNANERVMPINWTTISQNFTSSALYSICYGDGKFVAVGSNSTMAYSTDGINWITVLDKSGSGYPFQGHIRSVCYGNEKFIAVGDYGRMGYSTDGTTWKASQSFTESHIYSICYGNGKFVAVGYKGSMGYSTDGINWKAISQSIFDTDNIRSVCYGNGKFVAVGYNGRMGYSTDGINWTAVSQDFTKFHIHSICYGNGKFVASDRYGKMAYSQTGLAS